MIDDRVEIDDLRVNCIIGVHSWERKSPQEVRISLSMTIGLSPAAFSGDLIDTIDYSKLADEAETEARRGQYRLLESLAEALASLCLKQPNVLEARVRVRKPAAIRAAQAAVVEIVRRQMQLKPRLLGVLNLSPESRVTPSVAVEKVSVSERAHLLREAGCEVIELGARSTNPTDGAGTLSETEEIDRLKPAFRSLALDGFHISVETWSARTALWAMDEGAVMIDYTSAGLPDEVCRCAGESGTALVLVHMPYGDPGRMHSLAPINRGSRQIVANLSVRADAARAAGAVDVYVDPNTGIVHPQLDDYHKIELQMQAIQAARKLAATGYEVLINCPRKESLTSRIILSYLLLEVGPAWIRTHDPHIITTVRGLHYSDETD